MNVLTNDCTTEQEPEHAYRHRSLIPKLNDEKTVKII
jgi:hypothetical protein